MTYVVVGADVGGSSTRVAVAQPDGTVRSLVRAPGANPNAVGPGPAATIIGTALEEALAEARLEPTESIGPVVVGLAGGTRVASDVSFLHRITPGSAQDVRVVADLAVAFGSGTPADDGYVLVAGTGAVAGHVRDGALIAQRDGWGWLLGDDGAGFWIGRELVRSTLRAMETGTDLTSVQRAVLSRTGSTDRVGLIQHCYAEPPVALARLGELLAEHPDDPVGRGVADRAVSLLAELLLSLEPGVGLPVVVAGSVATAPGPVGRALSERLEAVLGQRLVRARAGVVGAVWTALRRAGMDEVTVHNRLVAALGG